MVTAQRKLHTSTLISVVHKHQRNVISVVFHIVGQVNYAGITLRIIGMHKHLRIVLAFQAPISIILRILGHTSSYLQKTITCQSYEKLHYITARSSKRVHYKPLHAQTYQILLLVGNLSQTPFCSTIVVDLYPQSPFDVNL